jgi:hypothetical protein
MRLSYTISWLLNLLVLSSYLPKAPPQVDAPVVRLGQSGRNSKVRRLDDEECGDL